jgi:hypothetical protein
MKKIDLFMVFLTVMLLVFVTGCGAKPQVTKLSENRYNVFVGGYTTHNRAELMQQWEAASKESCKGGEYTIKSGPNTGKQGTVGITLDGTIECK